MAVTLRAPISKSYGVRMVFAAMFSGDIGSIRAKLRSGGRLCGDILSAIGAAEDFLAGRQTLHVGESALSARIVGCAAAVLGREIEISGARTLPARPLGLDVLGSYGVEVSGDFVPLSVRGKLEPGNIIVDGSRGSQVATGLLMALPLAVDDSVLRVENLVSAPYIDITLDVMERFGIDIERRDSVFRIRGGQKYSP